MESEKRVTYLNVKALESGTDRIVEGWASTPREDRAGDVVVPEGASYELPLPLLFAHKHDEPIGSVISASVTKAGIRIRAKLTAGVARAEEVWKLIKDGALTAVSIGFLPIKSTPLANGGMRFDSWSWYELSVVSVPCNPDAKIAIGKGIAYANETPPKPAFRVPLRPKRTLADCGNEYFYRSFDWALTRLPAELRGMADFRRCDDLNDDIVFRDETGKPFASVDKFGTFTALGEYAPPSDPPKELTRNASPQMTPEFFGKAVGICLDKPLREVHARLDAIEQGGGAMRWKGFWHSGDELAAGSVVVHDGNLWIANNETAAEPVRHSASWTLLARK